MGLKEQIVAAEDLERIKVDVPEWQCSVWLRTMSGLERDQVDRDIVKAPDGDQGWSRRMLARVMVDESGTRIFGDADITALEAKSGKVLRRLVDVAAKLNGYGREEEREKN